MSILLMQCKQCGKMFIPDKDNLHKSQKNENTYYYCSYNCWRKSGGDNGNK